MLVGIRNRNSKFVHVDNLDGEFLQTVKKISASGNLYKKSPNGEDIPVRLEISTNFEKGKRYKTQRLLLSGRSKYIYLFENTGKYYLIKYSSTLNSGHFQNPKFVKGVDLKLVETLENGEYYIFFKRGFFFGTDAKLNPCWMKSRKIEEVREKLQSRIREDKIFAMWDTLSNVEKEQFLSKVCDVKLMLK